MPSIPYAADSSKAIQVKRFAVTRTMTAGTDRAFVLPKGAQIIGFVLTGTASDAGTTATLSVGTTSGTPVEYVNAQSVLAAGAGNGVNLLKGVTGVGQTPLTSDTLVYVKYSETGGASTVGSWTLWVAYTTGAGLSGVF
jgi:hypothetical protein